MSFRLPTIDRPKPVVLVSYWPTPSLEDTRFREGVVIRHTSHADAVYIASCQDDPRTTGPSACVWMVPATNPEDPDYERAPALERPARIRGAAYWLGEVPVTRHYSVGSHGVPGYVLLSYFSFREDALSIGQCESVPVMDLPAVMAIHAQHGRTRAGYKYVNGKAILTDDMHR